MAYAELPPDERGGTCAAFMGRCLRFFEGLGVGVERVMTDNGPGYTRPYSPWQNGKAERMNRTLAQEWQYARAYAGGGREGLRPPDLHRAL